MIAALAERGSEVYVAGDDDQSIYGFRHAKPEGLRNFLDDYEGAEECSLSVCKRCDEEVLEAALFVICQDTRRAAKSIVPDLGRDGGRVDVLHFRDQRREAAGIAEVCLRLVEDGECGLGDILILLELTGGSFTPGSFERLWSARSTRQPPADAGRSA